MKRPVRSLASHYALIAFMLALTVGLGLFLHRTMRQKLDSHFSEHQNTLDTAYRASIQMYRLAIESFYANSIARPDILNLVENAVNSSGRERDLARGRLYRQLFPAYRAIKADIPLQLQFYLPDGTSLLRFHKPDRYGDPQHAFQHSVRLANKNKRPVHGFESGKVRSGFRYVYPLIHQGRHLGSIGASVTAKGIRDALAELDPNREYAFLLSSNLTKPHIFPEQQWLYSAADIHPDYLLEDANAILPESPPPLSAGAISINRQLRNDPQVQAAMSQGRPLTTHAAVDNAHHIVSLLPIRDIRGQVAGYLVSYALDPVCAAIFQEFVVYLSSMLFVALVMTVLLLRLRRWALALSTEQRNLQAMNNALAEGLYVTDRDGIIERVNPAACKILGYSEEEMVGATAHDLLHCHDENAFQHKDDCPFFQAISRGERYDGEEKFRHKSDAILMVKVACRPIRAEGELLGAVTAFHDITLRKQTEERLRQSEETARKLSTAVEQSPTAVIITDLAGTIEYANPRFLQMTGYERQEAIGANPRLLKSGQMSHDFYKNLWEVIRAGRTWKGELLNRRKSGELYWELCAISPIRDHFGSITHYIAIKEDISERKRMEETLRENEQIQRTLIESLPVPLMIIDAASRVVENVNPAAIRLIGADEDQIVGHRCHRYLCPAHADSCPILDLDQAVNNSEKVVLQPDGSEIPVLKTVKKIVIRGREKLLECMMDIRSRLEAEDALRQATAKAEQLAREAESANRAKSTFLASMSHEIRTPLNAILGYSQLLQQEAGLQPHQLEQVQIINRSGDHLLELINNILEMSRIEAGHVTMQAVPLDFRQMMADLASMFRLSCQQKALRFDIILDEVLPRYLAADPAKLRQVLINLLSNAVKFTARGGITVETRGSTVDGHEWLIAVDICDSGSGIAPEEQDKLFGAFEQTSSGRAAGQGTGLGLSISRAYAERMGGGLRLVESAVGVGSRFRFTFCAQQCAGDELQLAPGARHGRITTIAPQHLPVRALIVEDDRNSRDMLDRTLSAVGFSVESVTCGEEALERFAECPMDVVLLDIHMPGIDGYQTARSLRSLPGGEKTKILIVTAGGFNPDDLTERAQAAGADRLLAKPFKTGELYDTLRQLCGFDYLYANPKAAPKEATEIAVDVRALLELPDALRLDLREAVEQGDMLHFAELLDRVAINHGALRNHLSGLADRYEYDRLLDLLGRG